MTIRPADILRHAVEARLDAERLLAAGHFGLAKVRRRDAAALRAMLTRYSDIEPQDGGTNREGVL